MAAAGPVLAACQCDTVPDRPCSAPATQEDLLCDACRLAREPGMIHGSSSLFAGTVIRAVSHFAIDARETPLRWGNDG